MEPNLAEIIYIRSSINFLHFVPFCQQIWPPRAILVSDWLLFKKIFSSENAGQNGATLGKKNLYKILYKASSPLSLYRSPDNRMILKQISKGDNHYIRKQQPS
jgi:hypothetical protein